MFNRLFRKAPAPLSGAPAVRRQKTYSAQSGYVYQYFYEGHRPAVNRCGIEYVFDVSSDRKTSVHVSVVVSHAALESWQKERGRNLSSSEQYAIAKMALFQAFDERENPDALREAVHVDATHVRAFLETLDID